MEVPSSCAKVVGPNQVGRAARERRKAMALKQANADPSYEYGYGREPASYAARPRIKRGLLGVTACSVSDALALRDYEITLLRRSHRQLRQAMQAREVELQGVLAGIRSQAQAREVEIDCRIAALDRGTRKRDETLRAELERIRRVVGRGGWDRGPISRSNREASRPAGLTAVSTGSPTEAGD